MKTLLAVILTLALAIPALADMPVWERPVGECTYPNGTVVTDPGRIPLPCDIMPICVAWDADRECVEEGEYQIPGCTALSTSPEYRDALETWLTDSHTFNWCVLIDYFTFIYANIPH